MTIQSLSRNVAMPSRDDLQFSPAELDHLWSDPTVDDSSLAKIAAGNVRRFAECPVDVLQSLNAWTVENSDVGWEYWGKKEIAEALGIKEVLPRFVPVLDPQGDPILDEETAEPLMTKEIPPSKFCTGKGTDQKRWTMEKNLTNRPLNLENMGGIAQVNLAMRIVANAETWIFDSLGNATSAQHRGGAAFVARLQDPTLPDIPVLVARNIPAIFADTADTGRTRTASDIQLRDPHILQLDSLVDPQGKGLGADAPAERAKMGRELASVLRLVEMRCCGKNVNASVKPREGGYYLYTHFRDELDKLVNLVYNESVSLKVGTKEHNVRTIFGRANLVSAIVLSELSAIEPIAEQADRKLVVEPVDHPHIELNLDTWAERLTQMRTEVAATDGPIYSAIMKIIEANADSKQKTQDKFASTCYVVSLLSDAELEGFQPKSTGSPLPKKESVSTKAYPHFGGADIGPWKYEKATD